MRGCRGYRLSPRAVREDRGFHIGEVCELSVRRRSVVRVARCEAQRQAAGDRGTRAKEIRARLTFLNNVGLDI